MNRNEQIKTERRRRNTGALGGRRQRLWVDETKLDREKYEYRFVNDDATGRLHQLTVQDDWEIVPDRDGEVKPDGSDLGARASTIAGVQANGAPLRSVLCRKLKTYYEDDQREKSRAIDEKEASLKSGAVPGAGGAGMYVPAGGISIDRG